MGLDNPVKLALVIIILLLVFGAKRLPEIGRSLGKSMREFKSATKGLADDVKDGLGDDEDDVSSAPQAKQADDTKTGKTPKGRAKRPAQ
jgi:sec-independent protein translocase protein TatA